MITVILTAGFGTAAAMWGLGYLLRLPGLEAPAPLLFVLLVAALLGGGAVFARWAGRAPRAAFGAGLVTGGLNMLVLLAVVADFGQAWLWIPASILLSGLLATAGAALVPRRPAAPPVEDAAPFAWVAVATTALLLGVGGLVTSKDAGLAVVDWPNSFGSLMFLYPLSRMTGGIYFEHAHRLFGSLVGLTVLTLAVLVQRTDRRRWVRRLAWAAFAMVVLQGVLGGLRVTGTFTFSTSADDTAPSLALAVVHGVFGQLVFGTLVALAAFLSRTWRTAAAAEFRPGAERDRSIGALAVGLLVVQLVLGAVQRHYDALLFVHISLAVVVAPLALMQGGRAWGLNPHLPVLRRLGLALIGATSLQLLLGVLTYVAKGMREANLPGADPAYVVLATSHQWCGAVVLACAVSVLAWTVRLLQPVPSGTARREAPAAG